ncbi:endonuclease/exonuclease/phosphatase family protein [Pontixanthobacter gangjinensis]|uniref:Endonuclease n=1 Tax=Pontixanthobacter gangjinensis TaxID=1028742 RepID=A0A6I4SIZ3_9SPHN|nr:endonuclease/exonuclease/phosphatase family protein [Pontixanthobacter gangjinensis]MXO55534.1 endonuclease [Pontixanthobacter gangjinensis]
MQLTFASYNIHKAVGTDRRRDPDRIISVLREIDADIIAIQEVDQRIGDRASVLSRAALDDTHWKVVPLAKRPRSMGWHGNALLIRREFTVLDCAPLDLPMVEPRGAVCADLDCGGHRVRVAGMHLCLSGLRRRDQIQAILRHVGGLADACPTVLMGDFNQWGLRSGAMQEFGKDWQHLTLGRSFPSRQPIAQLDRIVASHGWRVGESGVHHSALSAQASDHLPVWADLELPNI